MIRLEFTVAILLTSILAIWMFLPKYLENRELRKRVVKDHIGNSLRIAGRKLDKRKMYHFSKKANMITVMDNPNLKNKEEN